MNPFDLKPKTINDCIMDWNELYPEPYQKREVDPYTRTRIILLNGTEFEANGYSHQFHRHCDDNDLRRELALIRRSEQQQQKLLSALKPLDETLLEHTIGYEQLAVDLTCALAKRETDKEVIKALRFALLEDFDHLYRYADLLDMETGVHAEDLVGRYTEIMPGRPTISEHRYPYDTITHYINKDNADLITKLNVAIITAAEQQTMNYYMNINGAHTTDLGRKLYQEIAMIEEQHVTMYGGLMDPRESWLEGLFMHQYTECFLYYSCMQTESCPRIKQIWNRLFEQEVSHLHHAAHLLEKLEGKHYLEVIPNPDFPEVLKLQSNIDYVREAMQTVQMTATRESYADVVQIRPDFEFFKYQKHINGDVDSVPSHQVIDQYIQKMGQDYRFEVRPNPIEDLRDRTKDNTSVGMAPIKGIGKDK